MPVLHPAEERKLLLDAARQALERLKNVQGTSAAREILQNALDVCEPPLFREINPAVRIGAFNELSMAEIAKILNVEMGSFTVWLKKGFPKGWRVQLEPFPLHQRMCGQVRLWNGPEVARWFVRNGTNLKLCYKRNKATSGKMTCNN